MNIQCIPYEATMSLAVCESRKKAALAGDGLTNRKCIDCKEGVAMTEEVLKCKVCGTVVEDGKKFFRKSQECKKCYDKRWRKEKLRESADRVKKADSASHSDTGVAKIKAKPDKPAPVKEAPTNGAAAAIIRIEGEIEYLEDQKETIEYKLSVLRDVRGMLG